MKHFQIAHICGQGKIDESFGAVDGYRQFEYVDKELADLFACAAMVVSRAGANSIYELLTLQKPHVLIPLSKKVSRGDQVDNAAYFESKKLSVVVDEEKLEKEFMPTVLRVFSEKDHYQENIAAYNLPNAVQKITDLIGQVVNA